MEAGHKQLKTILRELVEYQPGGHYYYNFNFVDLFIEKNLESFVYAWEKIENEKINKKNMVFTPMGLYTCCEDINNG